MVTLNDLATRLLHVEQQLIAYEKLHADEFAELWQSLNECKQIIAAGLPDQSACDVLAREPYDPCSTGVVGQDQPEK